MSKRKPLPPFPPISVVRAAMQRIEALESQAQLAANCEAVVRSIRSSDSPVCFVQSGDDWRAPTIRLDEGETLTVVNMLDDAAKKHRERVAEIKSLFAPEPDGSDPFAPPKSGDDDVTF